MSEVHIDNVEEIFDLVATESGKVVVFFTAPSWCGPCRQFRPAWDRTVEELDDVTFLYVDIDKVPDAGVDYEIRSVPTVKLFENGTYVRNIKAPQPALTFVRDINS